MFNTWQRQPLYVRIRWLRYILPILIVIVVFFYQLQVARGIEAQFGHSIHYFVEIAFYSLLGPIVTWGTLIWVEHRIVENNLLEQQFRMQAERLNDLTNSSADAIISLDERWQVVSWNLGAENIFAFSETEMLGNSIQRILPDLSLLHSSSVMSGAKIRALTRDNQYLIMDVTITHEEASDEDDPAHLLIMRDITPQKEREEIVEEERARIARDLHDSVAQSLYFMALKADMLKIQLQDDKEKQHEISTLGSSARDVLREVRRTIFSLSSFVWESDDFLLVLEKFIYNYANEVGWELNLDFAPGLEIPSRLQAALFRITQESFNNIAKHANANYVAVTIGMLNAKSGIELRIDDNGNGFVLEEEKDSGFGIPQMKQRVIDLQGEFFIESDLGKGSSIVVTFPSL